MKVLVSGDRNGFDPVRILEVLYNLPEGDVTIIHGDAEGVDRQAAKIAVLLGYTIVPYPADWDQYKKAAGPIRNRQMYDLELPDEVIAFHRNIATSKGTKDMVAYARSKGCKVTLIEE